MRTQFQAVCRSVLAALLPTRRSAPADTISTRDCVRTATRMDTDATRVRLFRSHACTRSRRWHRISRDLPPGWIRPYCADGWRCLIPFHPLPIPIRMKPRLSRDQTALAEMPTTPSAWIRWSAVLPDRFRFAWTGIALSRMDISRRDADRAEVTIISPLRSWSDAASRACVLRAAYDAHADSASQGAKIRSSIPNRSQS